MIHYLGELIPRWEPAISRRPKRKWTRRSSVFITSESSTGSRQNTPGWVGEKLCSSVPKPTEKGVVCGRVARVEEEQSKIKDVSQGHHSYDSRPCLPTFPSGSAQRIAAFPRNISIQHIITGCKTTLSVIQVVTQPGPEETIRSVGVQQAGGFTVTRKLVHQERQES